MIKLQFCIVRFKAENHLTDFELRYYFDFSRVFGVREWSYLGGDEHGEGAMIVGGKTLFLFPLFEPPSGDGRGSLEPKFPF